MHFHKSHHYIALLKFYSAVCQLYLNNTGREKKLSHSQNWLCNLKTLEQPTNLTKTSSLLLWYFHSSSSAEEHLSKFTKMGTKWWLPNPTHPFGHVSTSSVEPNWLIQSGLFLPQKSYISIVFCIYTCLSLIILTVSSQKTVTVGLGFGLFVFNNCVLHNT